jgi:hypothetical protein
VLGQNVSGKIFVTDGRINEWRARGDEASETECARRATGLVLIGLRRVAIAIVTRGFRFHLRATIRLFDFRNQRLTGKRCERDRRAERETGEKPEYSSHGSEDTRDSI